MTDLDVTTLGASSLDPVTNALTVQAVNEVAEGEGEPFGEGPMYGALGVTARPAPATDDGHASGVVAADLGGQSGAVIAARDTRTTGDVAALGPGETCVHATGPGYEARSFYKDNLIAHIVGDDFVVVQDRKNKRYTVSCFGLAFEMSESGGIVMESGGAGISIKDGAVHIRGKVILGGMAATPATAVIMGVSGVSGVPAPGVFIGV